MTLREGVVKWEELVGCEQLGILARQEETAAKRDATEHNDVKRQARREWQPACESKKKGIVWQPKLTGRKEPFARSFVEQVQIVNVCAQSQLSR